MLPFVRRTPFFIKFGHLNIQARVERDIMPSTKRDSCDAHHAAPVGEDAGFLIFVFSGLKFRGMSRLLPRVGVFFACTIKLIPKGFCGVFMHHLTTSRTSNHW